MKKLLVLSILVLVIVICINPLKSFHKYYLTDCSADSLEQQTTYDMYLEPVDMQTYTKTILSYADRFSISTSTEIQYEDTSYPIYQIDVINTSSERNLLVFAATHGNEFATALAIPPLLDNIITNPEKYKNWNLRLVTPINPVGLAYGSRYNQNGCDINRDFEYFETTGAQVQRDAITSFSPDLIVSFHEGPHDSFYFFATESITKKLRSNIVEVLKKNNISLARTMSGVPIPLTTPGVAPENPISKFAKSLLGIHMIGRYSETQGIGIITTEGPWTSEDVSERIEPHLRVIEAIVTSELN